MSQDRKTELEAKKQLGIQVRIDREALATLDSRFVNDLVVQHQRDYFILAFSEIQYPLLLSDEERQNALESLKSLPAKAVARLVLTPETMRKFIQAMTKNLEDYEKMMKVLDKLEEGENENG